jgi:tyrosine-protein phosphatase SIW14
MKLTRRTIVLLVVIVAVGGAGCAGALWYTQAHPVHHFAKVDPGILYRSGQPNEEQLTLLTERYHLRTVVNLRGTEGNADWYVVEQRFCAEHHLNFVTLDLIDRDHIRSGLRRFLEVMADAANHPVLVHCEIGSARTGFAVAAYRIVFQKWSFEKALAEAESFNFKPEAHLNPEYVKILRELAGGADWHTLAD